MVTLQLLILNSDIALKPNKNSSQKNKHFFPNSILCWETKTWKTYMKIMVALHSGGLLFRLTRHPAEQTNTYVSNVGMANGQLPKAITSEGASDLHILYLHIEDIAFSAIEATTTEEV